MKCNVCGKELDTTDKRVRYCSAECRRKAYLQQLCESTRKRRRTDAEYRKKTYAGNVRRYYEKKRERYEEIAMRILELVAPIEEFDKDEIESVVKTLEENCRLRH